MAERLDHALNETPYTFSVFRFLAPAYLRYICSSRSFHVDDVPDHTYIELGCGNGVSLLVMAAANPAARFIGVDLMPAHIAFARSLAKRAGLTNVEFIERAFEDLTPSELPQADFVVSHGVLSWVPAAARTALLGLFERHLKPGGIGFVSYNIVPGWARIAPLRELMSEYAAIGSGSATERLRKSLALLERLAEAGEGHFVDKEQLAKWVEGIRKNDVNYSVHEYLAPAWELFHFHKVVALMAEAKMQYAGSADLVDHVEAYALLPAAISALAPFPDIPFKETLRDYLRNRRFRKDVFIRGARPLTRSQSLEFMRRQRFVLARPTEAVEPDLKIPTGSVRVDPQQYEQIMWQLAQGPVCVADLSTARDEVADEAEFRRLALLAIADRVVPAEAHRQFDRSAAARFNSLMASESQGGAVSSILVSPYAGGAVGASQEQLSAILEGAAAGTTASDSLAMFLHAAGVEFA